jgi:hypothetical protein
MTAFKILDLIGVNSVKGDVGIEIEMEGNVPFPREDALVGTNWRSEADGSLRGHSVEYIVDKPVFVNEVGETLKSLQTVLKRHKTKPVYSFRAGVHVHVNVQKLTMYQLGTLAALYYCVEHSLVKFCGNRREGNLFCLRNEDAEYSLFQLQRALSTGDISYLATDDIRYSSMNLRAVTRYGSVEFRAMETQPDLTKIEEWCHILVKLRDAAVQIEDRSDIPYQMSFKGPENWLYDILGESLFKLVNYEGINKDIMRGMRSCQILMYAER